jgi:hypothetical protein
VPGVEEEPVSRRVEDAVHGQSELHHAQVGTDVTARARHLGDQEVADFSCQDGQLLGGQALEVSWTSDRAQQRRGAVGHSRKVYRADDVSKATHST